MNALVFVGVGVLIVAAFSLYVLLRRERSARADSDRSWDGREKTWERERAESEHRLTSLIDHFHELARFQIDAQENAKLQPFAERLVHLAANAAQANEVVFLYLNPRSHELEPMAATGLSPDQVRRSHALLGEGLVGKAAFSDEEVRVEAGTETGGAWTPPAVLRPISVAGRPSAVLVLAQPSGGGFNSAGMEQVDLLTEQAAAFLGAFALSDRLEASVDQTIQALAEAISARDTYTHRHSDRTRALVDAVGADMGLPAALVRHIRQGALLHDIGKIGISDAILHKAEKLLPEEYDEMKKHPEIGFRILQTLPALRNAASIVLYHQEWFNGAGYPEGLAAEEIPLGARIVSVIDAWDAMTSNRPYRPAMLKSAAIAELRRQAGTQFDPQVVDAFVRVIERLEREGHPVTEHPSDALYHKPAPANA